MYKKWHWAVPIGIALIGIILSIFDFKINDFLFQPKNGFGIAMSAFGTLPVYMGLAAVGVGYFTFALKDKIIWRKILLILLSIGCIGVSIYFQGDMVISRNAFNIEDMWYVGIAIGVVCAALGGTLGYFMFKDVKDSKSLLAMVLIPMVLLGGVIVVEILKRTMSRPRMRFLENYGAEYGVEFAPWWLSSKSIYKDLCNTYPDKADFFKEEFRSFPSGHTVTATSLIPFLIFIPRVTGKWKKQQTLLFYIGVAQAMLMGFSRMLVGAHFLSDVSFAMLISSTIGLCIDIIFFNKNKDVSVEKETLSVDNKPAEEISK